MSRSALPPFSHQLPYWTVRDVPVGGARLPVVVLVDGTLFVGFESTGADVFSADNAHLNRIAQASRRALNLLPAGAYLQSVWETGASFEAMIAAYERRGGGRDAAGRRKSAVLVEQRRARARMLREDASLRRGRLVFFVGQKQALGPLSSHARDVKDNGGRSGFLSLFAGRRHPQMIDAATFQAAVERLSEVAARVKDELSSTGAVLSHLSGQALLTEMHKALNPITSKSVSVFVTDHALELPPSILREPAYAIHRPASLREQLPLGDLVWSEDHFTLDDPPALSRALTIQRLPAFTRPDLMMGVQFATDATIRLVSTFVATDREKLTERLIRKRNIAHAQAVGIVRDIAADVAFSEYEHVLEKMLTEDQRVFHASVTAVVHAGSHEALDRATRELKDAFSDAGALLTTETGRQLGAFLGSLPGNGFAAPRQHQLITNSAADFLPTFLPSEGDPEPQLIFHTRQATLRAISLEPSSRRANENALVFGGSGSGKSFSTACAFEQAFLIDGAPLLVVDVQGPELSSYKVLAELFDGQYTALASDGDAAFSPFVPHSELFVSASGDRGGERGGERGADRDAAGAVDEEALRFMTALVALMGLPELETRREKAFALEIARTAILQAYDATGSSVDSGQSEARAPLLSDVAFALKNFEPEHEEHRAVAREMYLQLLAWLNDPVRARLLNRPARTSSLANRKQMQVYDFFGMEKDATLATVLLLSVSFAIWQQLKSHARDVRKLVVFDECWKLLTNQTASDLVGELFRTGRKWGASTWAITQNLADFQSSPIHKAVLNNASMIFLMQHAGDHAAVSEVCALNEREHSLFRQLKMRKGEFSEMLFVERGASSTCGGGMGGHASILRLVPTPWDLWLNTTDPADVGYRNRIINERGFSLLEAVRFCAERYPTGAPRARTSLRRPIRPIDDEGSHDAT